MDEKKKKLTEEQLKALLSKTCIGKSWFLMRKSKDYNRLALFLKINGIESIELGEKAYTYEVDLRDEAIAGAFILTEKPDADGTGKWHIAAMIVAPDYRGHKIGDIMYKKMQKLAKEEGADRIYVTVSQDVPVPDDMDGVTDAKSFWKAEGMAVCDGTSDGYEGTQLFSSEI